MKKVDQITSKEKFICNLCGENSYRVLSILKPTPLEDCFTSEINNLDKITLDPFCCTNCGLISLKTQVDPTASYSEYLYTSSTTVGLKEHFSLRAATLLDLYGLSKHELIIDLGCNDGSFLISFKDLGFENLLGVEPAANPSSKARKLGINIDQEFFNKKWVDRNINISPRLITANYMFANIPNPLSFMQECSRMMSSNSIFSIETGYHYFQFEKNMVDYVYHEHFYYFTLKSLQIMAEKSDLKIVSIRQNNHKGGSIEVDFMKNDTNLYKKTSLLLKHYLKNEEKILCDLGSYFFKLDERISESLKKIKSLLKSFHNKGVEIIVFGASHSTTTLLHLIQSKDFFIRNIIDDNSVKHGKYSPGSNLKVLSPESLKKENQKSCERIIICLAWQHSDSILKRHLGKLSELCWIIPFPETRIIYPNVK